MGIHAEHRVLQVGENFGGSYEVVVRDEDLEAAREVLPQDE